MRPRIAAAACGALTGLVVVTTLGAALSAVARGAGVVDVGGQEHERESQGFAARYLGCPGWDGCCLLRKRILG